MTPEEKLGVARHYVEETREAPLTSDQEDALVELVGIVATGRDGGPDTTNYAYLTWQRMKELADVLGVVPLKTVLYLESLIREEG